MDDLGGEFATPIINYPEVAILGVGAIRRRPRVVGTEVNYPTLLRSESADSLAC
jgi:pyruvate/2-oxoglutarate dehydrogenase complex dihydrolipoamide acyltransferase (E2) component